ncbi:MAG: anthranilate phosphoribosyltransferase [Actinomycetota bacterium]
MSEIAVAGSWSAVISQLLAKKDLSASHAGAAMRSVLSGEATPSQITAFIVALRAKGETEIELEGMLAEVRRAAERVFLPEQIAEHSLDIVGTGGDHSHSVNVSTMAGLVVAGAKIPVCKHGSRASSSKSGAADVLEALGVAIEIDGVGVAKCVEETGFGFCFAQRFHPAFRFTGPSRREIGVPTVFNLLGPMANPASISFMVVGVGDPQAAPVMAKALMTRGIKRAWVVHGHGSMDELSLSGKCPVVEVHGNKSRSFEIDATEIGLGRADVASVRGGLPSENAKIFRELLDGAKGPVRDIVVLNAAAGIVVAGKADDLRAGVEIAAESIDSGAASDVLDNLIRVSNDAAKQMAH